VRVNGSAPTSLPTKMQGLNAAEIERHINATDAEDALKYLPSLRVRKRSIGDYNHAVLSTRASGTGNSARSLVFADGILLSNLLGNGAGFTPRWGVIIGAGTQHHTVQDHAKLKLAHDLSPGLRASYTFGLWRNASAGSSTSYLRDAAGIPSYALAAHSGTAKTTPISVDGKAYALAANDFGQGREALEHRMHGLSLKSHAGGAIRLGAGRQGHPAPRR